MPAAEPGRNRVLLRGVYALFHEVGETPEGTLFRYGARRASLVFLCCSPLIVVAGAALWNLFRLPPDSRDPVVIAVALGFFGGIVLLFAGFIVVSLWTHRELLIDPGSRRLTYRTRSPFGLRAVVAEAKTVRGVTLRTASGLAPWFVEIVLEGGEWLDLGQGPLVEATRLAHRVSSLLGAPVLDEREAQGGTSR